MQGWWIGSVPHGKAVPQGKGTPNGKHTTTGPIITTDQTITTRMIQAAEVIAFPTSDWTSHTHLLRVSLKPDLFMGHQDIVIISIPNLYQPNQEIPKLNTGQFVDTGVGEKMQHVLPVPEQSLPLRPELACTREDVHSSRVLPVPGLNLSLSPCCEGHCIRP